MVGGIQVTRIDRAAAFKTVEEKLAPFIGSQMARSSCALHGGKLGLVDPTLSPEQLDAFLQLIAKAMRVFVGPTKTDLIVAEINATLGTGGDA